MESQLEKRHLWSGKCTICVLDYGGRQQDQRSPEEGEGAPHTTQPETGPDQVNNTRNVYLYPIFVSTYSILRGLVFNKDISDMSKV